MIRILFGHDLFETKADVILCPTNTVGAMGRGVAKTVKSICPKGFRVYSDACKRKIHTLDDPILVGDAYNQILCVASKEKWWDDSTVDTITRGLSGLVRWLKHHPEIKSVALPVLGSGAGNRYDRLDHDSLVKLHLSKLAKKPDVMFYLHVKERGS